jgi:hypothetical protein
MMRCTVDPCPGLLAAEGLLDAQPQKRLWQLCDLADR